MLCELCRVRVGLNDEGEIKKLQARAHGMLPGVAGICLFLLTLTMINAFAALQGKFGDGRGQYGEIGRASCRERV